MVYEEKHGLPAHNEVSAQEMEESKGQKWGKKHLWPNLAFIFGIF